MIISLEDVSYKYAIEPILDHVNFVVNEKDKWGVVGLNGAGKSTFMKILAGIEKPDDGKVTVLKKYKISYCSQNSEFSPRKSVYETVRSGLREETEVYQINAILNKLGITDYEQKIDVLSGGQKKRVALAISLIQKADLYLLDEPTNHLDIPAKEALESALEKYDGTILFVSHDRMFLKKMATRVLEMDSVGKIYDLNYEEYLDKKANNELIESVTKVEKEVKPQTVSFTDLKTIKNRVAKLEVLLDEAEQDLEAMRELRYEPEYYQDYRKMEELDAKIDDKHNEIAALMKEWEEKMAMME